MKTKQITLILAITVAPALLSTGISAPTWAQSPKMKMTTDIPEAITTPDSVETRLGTLSFFDGYPDDATSQKVYDNLDFMNNGELVLDDRIMFHYYATGITPAMTKPQVGTGSVYLIGAQDARRSGTGQVI